MSGTIRRLVMGVLAISLFVCSSLSAFAIETLSSSFPSFTRLNFFVNGTNVDSNTVPSTIPYFTSFSEDFSYTVSTVTDTRVLFSISNLDYSNASFIYTASGNSIGYYTFVYTINSSVDLTKLNPRVGNFRATLNGVDRQLTSNDFVFDSYSSFIQGGSGYVNTFVLTVFLPSSTSTVDIVTGISFDSGFDITGYSYSSSFSVDSPAIDFPDYELPGDGGLNYDVNGTIGSDTVRLVFNWNYFISNLSFYWHYDLAPFFSSLFRNVYSGLSSIANGIGSNFSVLFDRMDKQDDDYAAVTDPSTSEEIQETQGMIDTVEGFESQLYSNITTEFDKIDFTTPTNLAAPVAYIGDKVTRTMNSLGNYQPLIFVPLTLGIMLIMLGRGITALGSMVSASSRAAARNRSEGDDS